MGEKNLRTGIICKFISVSLDWDWTDNLPPLLHANELRRMFWLCSAIMTIMTNECLFYQKEIKSHSLSIKLIRVFTRLDILISSTKKNLLI